MEENKFVSFSKKLGQHLLVESVNYVDSHFDSLGVPEKLAPYVKLTLAVIKSELAKYTDGLATEDLVKDLHKHSI